MAWLNRREGRCLFQFERQIAARADASLFVSEAEAALFREATAMGRSRVKAFENGVALQYYKPEIGRAHVCTPVPNTHIVCRLHLDNIQSINKTSYTYLYTLLTQLNTL